MGELRAEDAGRNVVLMGWVNRRRDHGGLIFLDLRDRSGMAQVVVDEKVGAAHDKADAARPEFVVAVKGHVRRRGAGLENPNMPTGEIEVVADELLLLNEAKTPPFSPAEDAIANEEVRLKYRYLDLRRVEMQANFALRSRVAMAIRNYLVGDLGLTEPGLNRLIHSAYRLLGLITYFTAGVQEVRAWTIPKGAKAPQAAGVIHSDFERGFIKADAYHCENLFELGSEQAVKVKGLYRSEGKEYVVKDGDILFFKFNV